VGGSTGIKQKAENRCFIESYQNEPLKRFEQVTGLYLKDLDMVEFLRVSPFKEFPFNKDASALIGIKEIDYGIKIVHLTLRK
jgi:hypothetical protein